MPFSQRFLAAKHKSTANLADVECNAQTASPLFSLVPGEIRTVIFRLALAEYEDPAHQYDFDSFYYRPGYRARKRIATPLLRTCRRVWLETWHLPSSLAEHAWWLGDAARSPPGKCPAHA